MLHISNIIVYNTGWMFQHAHVCYFLYFSVLRWKHLENLWSRQEAIRHQITTIIHFPVFPFWIFFHFIVKSLTSIFLDLPRSVFSYTNNQLLSYGKPLWLLERKSDFCFLLFKYLWTEKQISLMFRQSVRLKRHSKCAQIVNKWRRHRMNVILIVYESINRQTFKKCCKRLDINNSLTAPDRKKERRTRFCFGHDDN